MALLLSSAAAQADLSISNKPTQNMSCNAGVCVATAKKAVLNVGDLQAMLASGNATVKTGSIAKNVEIDEPLTWANTSRLTLDAQQSIIVKKPVTITGSGALTIATNDGDSNGAFATSNKGAVTFWDLASGLVINGENYSLAGDIKTLAADIAAKPAGNFALAKSYDAKADGPYSSVPIPTTFAGKLEGLGNRLANLTVQDSSSGEVGLFANLGSGSVVENITLSRVNISGAAAESVGSFVGESFGTLRNTHATGRITASIPDGTGGGLAGGNEGVITQSSANCMVSGGWAAGLAGEDSGTINNSFASGSEHGGVMGGLTAFEVGTIEDSYSTGSIKTDASVEAGGIAGITSAFALVERSFSTGSITTGDGSFVGGIVGYIDGGAIDQSFAAGSLSVGMNGAVGGLVAGACGCEGNAAINNSYAAGSARGKSGSQIGGIVGFTQEDIAITATYSTGAVNGNGAYKGGFIGFDGEPGDIATGYWDLDTSGISDPANGAGNVKNDSGLTGLTDLQLKSGLPGGFDPKIWGQSPNINNGYP
ncbi:MAG TPA: hypothetical protein VHW69_10020, partial [Rhizomicrobium sp.]|nr:hypothetical protein [Rhizomicrobium sp.]